jgi:hypothetical protein
MGIGYDLGFLGFAGAPRVWAGPLLGDGGEELEECGMWFECMVVEGQRIAGERVASRECDIVVVLYRVGVVCCWRRTYVQLISCRPDAGFTIGE